jgi:hypothetical protein
MKLVLDAVLEDISQLRRSIGTDDTTGEDWRNVTLPEAQGSLDMEFTSLRLFSASDLITIVASKLDSVAGILGTVVLSLATKFTWKEVEGAKIK